jgi:regulator of nucleoside diphosphate kinase
VSELPGITLSSLDLDRLEALLAGLANPGPEADALQAELDRAIVVEPRDVPSTVVTMNSTVRFVVEQTGEEFERTLCYPRDVNGQPDRVSVLAPIGSALLGLSVGQEINWPVPGGRQRSVRIVEVVYQPERTGDYHS